MSNQAATKKPGRRREIPLANNEQVRAVAQRDSFGHLTVEELRRVHDERKRVALAGKPGTDYFPNEKCEECGEVLWCDGKRYVMDHDWSKHAGGSEGPQAGAQSAPQRGPQLRNQSPARVAQQIDQQARALRSMGQRDDDD